LGFALVAGAIGVTLTSAAYESLDARTEMGSKSVSTSGEAVTEGAPTATRLAQSVEIPSAMVLRRFSETADGLRDTTVVLVRRTRFSDKRKTYHVMLHNDTVATADSVDSVLVRLQTPSTASRPRIDEVSITLRNPVTKKDTTVKVCDDFDAIFYSESAVDKFVFPYYEHLRIVPDDKVQELKKLYRDKTLGAAVIAVGHRNPSRYALVSIKDGCPSENSGSIYSPDVGSLMFLVRPSADSGATWLTSSQLLARRR
jgi:hypothetical protein